MLAIYWCNDLNKESSEMNDEHSPLPHNKEIESVSIYLGVFKIGHTQPHFCLLNHILMVTNNPIIKFCLGSNCGLLCEKMSVSPIVLPLY